jgi:hypothetical protein
MADQEPVPGRPVEGELVEPKGGTPAAADADKTYFHPLSGVVILSLDTIAFGLDLFSGFTALAVVSAATFGATYAAVKKIQVSLHGDDPKAARKKALIGATAAGVPIAITGTFVGAAILAASGLRGLSRLARFGRK